MTRSNCEQFTDPVCSRTFAGKSDSLTKRLKQILVASTGLVAVSFWADSASAADFTWINTISGSGFQDFNNNSSWSPSLTAPPTSTDNAFITNSSTNILPVVVSPFDSGSDAATANNVVIDKGNSLQVNSSGELNVGGVITVANGSLTLDGHLSSNLIPTQQIQLGSTSGAGLLTIDGGAIFFTNSISMNNISSSVVFNMNLPGTDYLTGVPITGNGTVVVQGVGNILNVHPFGAANTYSGATLITSGNTMQGGESNAFSPNSAVTVASGAVLVLGGFNQVIGSLAGAGTVTNNSCINSCGGGASATLTTGVDNTSTVFSGIIKDGTFATALTKVGAGTLTLSGNNSYTGQTTINGGTLTIAATGSITTSNVSNNAIFNNAGTVTAGSVTNNAGATITNFSGGTINDDLNNAGTVNNGGTYNANVATNSGTINNNAIWNGNVASNTGTINNSAGATWTGNVINNGSLTNAGTWIGQVTNSGTFLNTGLLNGGLTNTGTLDIRNGSATGVSTINGTFTAGPGSTLLIGVNLAGNSADLLRITGAATGATTVNVTTIGGSRPFLTSPIPFVTMGPNSNATFTLGNASAAGLVNYQVTQSSSLAEISSVLNPNAAAIPSNIISTVSAINTAFFEISDCVTALCPLSGPVVATPGSIEPNKFTGGVWMRATGGQLKETADISTTNLVQGGNLKTTTNYSGAQFGLDSGLLNLGGSGWAGHIGIMGGQLTAEGSNIASKVDYRVPYIGLYAVAAKDYFFSSLTIRHDFYEINVPAVFNALSGSGTSISGFAGYRFDFKDFFVEPAAGLSWGRWTFDNFSVGANQLLSFDPYKSLLGSLGVRIGKNIEGENSAWQPFVSAIVLNEFERNSTSQFVDNITSAIVPITEAQVGTFAQFGVGTAINIRNTGLIGFIRGDVRTGSKVEGASLTGGLRYTFH